MLSDYFRDLMKMAYKEIVIEKVVA